MTFRKDSLLYYECKIANIVLAILCLAIIPLYSSGTVSAQGSEHLLLWGISVFSFLVFVVLTWANPKLHNEFVTIDEVGISCQKAGKQIWAYKWDEILALKKSSRYNWPSMEIVVPSPSIIWDTCRDIEHARCSGDYFQLCKTAKQALEKFYKPKEYPTKGYFYITMHFSPEYEKTIFTKDQDDFYRHIETGEIYRKRPMYDFGWGGENGYELLPRLSFNDLIKLVEQPPQFPPKKKFWQKYSDYQIEQKFHIQQANIWRSNFYGAVSVIMEDHVEELIDFLYSKVDTDYFSNSIIRENFKIFSFDSEKVRAEGKIPGGIRTHTYEFIFNKYPKWREISSKVISQVYG